LYPNPPGVVPAKTARLSVAAAKAKICFIFIDDLLLRDRLRRRLVHLHLRHRYGLLLPHHSSRHHRDWKLHAG
jgi:hypothetical protein